MFQLNQIADLSLQKKRDASLSVKGRGGGAVVETKVALQI